MIETLISLYCLHNNYHHIFNILLSIYKLITLLILIILEWAGPIVSLPCLFECTYQEDVYQLHRLGSSLSVQITAESHSVGVVRDAPLDHIPQLTLRAVCVIWSVNQALLQEPKLHFALSHSHHTLSVTPQVFLQLS